MRSATKLNADLLSYARRLRTTGRAGTGIDNVDLDAATKRTIVAVNHRDIDCRPVQQGLLNFNIQKLGSSGPGKTEIPPNHFGQLRRGKGFLPVIDRAQLHRLQVTVNVGTV